MHIMENGLRVNVPVIPHDAAVVDRVVPGHAHHVVHTSTGQPVHGVEDGGQARSRRSKIRR